MINCVVDWEFSRDCWSGKEAGEFSDVIFSEDVSCLLSDNSVYVDKSSAHAYVSFRNGKLELCGIGLSRVNLCSGYKQIFMYSDFSTFAGIQ